jgi:hypothetical protein
MITIIEASIYIYIYYLFDKFKSFQKYPSLSVKKKNTQHQPIIKTIYNKKK